MRERKDVEFEVVHLAYSSNDGAWTNQQLIKVAIELLLDVRELLQLSISLQPAAQGKFLVQK